MSDRLTTPDVRERPQDVRARGRERHERERRKLAERPYRHVLTAYGANLLSSGVLASEEMYVTSRVDSWVLAVSCSDGAARYVLERLVGGSWEELKTLAVGAEVTCSVAAGSQVRLAVAAVSGAVMTSFSLQSRYLGE